MFQNKYHLKRFIPVNPHKLSGGRWRRLRVGLLGGSFNPPHIGHMHIARAAMVKYQLHAIWWLVSPQNPLKKDTYNFPKRMHMTHQFVSTPKMHVTDIECQLGIKYSLQTVRKLQTYFPHTHFRWIAGMDNAVHFHHWNGWREILKRIPITFFNRPPQAMAIKTSRIGLYKGVKNIEFSLTGRTHNISSTELRNKTFATRLKSAI